MGDTLRGKVAVITGAGRGIGQGVALCLADEGAKVVVNDLGCAVDGTGASQEPADDTVAQIRAKGGTAVADYHGVHTPEGGEAALKTALDSFGRLDILVNVAGILRDRMIFNMTEEEWDAVVRYHLKGHFCTIKPASILMRQQRSGRIINFTSISGLFGNSGQANYGAAKGGIGGITRVVARELGRYGVTCNCISPAARTRMGQSVPASAYEIRARSGIQGAGSMSPEERARMTSGGQRMEPGDIGPMVAYLASDEAGYINGQIFHCTGGIIALLNDEQPTRTIEKPTGLWTVEEITQLFPQTLGMDLVNPAPPQLIGEKR